MIRKAFFWLHLTAGSLAGIVILILSLTGVVLAWQRQIVRFADRGYRRTAAGGQQARVAPEALLATLVKTRQVLPTTLTIRVDREEPVAAEFGRTVTVYLNPWTGEILGEGSTSARGFFREVENWHRWLATGVESRATGRGITGACNLLFLGLLLSGTYLWMPSQWSVRRLSPILWFRRGLKGKARDWNWHHAIGIWCVVPLLVIVASGVVMSYPWANHLVYRVTGSEVPPPGGGGGGRASGERAEAPDLAMISFAGVDGAWQKAESQVADWKSIGLRIPASPKTPLVFTIDSGDGGQPNRRATLTLKRGSAEVVKWEPFSANSAGRQLRAWLRFSHTGEAGGIPGQSIAAVASLGAVVLVWTGLSLALRRMARAMRIREGSVAVSAKSPDRADGADEAAIR